MGKWRLSFAGEHADAVDGTAPCCVWSYRSTTLTISSSSPIMSFGSAMLPLRRTRRLIGVVGISATAPRRPIPSVCADGAGRRTFVASACSRFRIPPTPLPPAASMRCTYAASAWPRRVMNVECAAASSGESLSARTCARKRRWEHSARPLQHSVATQCDVAAQRCNTVQAVAAQTFQLFSDGTACPEQHTAKQRLTRAGTARERSSYRMGTNGCCGYGGTAGRQARTQGVQCRCARPTQASPTRQAAQGCATWARQARARARPAAALRVSEGQAPVDSAYSCAT
jgi:hypothetical protein